VPDVVYTHPEVTSVGKTTKQVKAKAYHVGKFPLLANNRANVIDDSKGIVKVVANKKIDKILGVHIMMSNTDKIIHEAVLALQYGASSEDVAGTCHTHPTVSEALKDACMQTFSKVIHI
jgi:dihydrolipoamide dehydrogenase